MKYFDDLRTSLWFVPSVMAIGAAVLAVALPYVDSHYISYDDRPEWLNFLIYSGSPDGARTVLGAIAGSMITVAGTVFSITIVSLSLASNQFGPRLLRNFLADRGNQVVLGTFISTFLYCILVMRRVYGGDDNRDPFVPDVSVSAAVALAMMSLGVLIYFIHHVAQSIQAPRVVGAVGLDLDEQIAKLFPKGVGHPDESPGRAALADRAERALDQEGEPVAATGVGYVQAINTDGLMRLAAKHDVVVRVALRPGDFVIPRTALAHVWPPASARPANGDGRDGDGTDGDRERLEKDVNEAFVLDTYRTPTQDIEFGLDQLVEVAVRALSPGINDPFTAVTCVDRLGAAISRLADKAFPSPYRFDDAGRMRVIAPPTSFKSVVDKSFDQIRQNARGIPAVSIRLAETIARLGELTPDPKRRESLRAQLDAIDQGVEAIDAACDRDDLRLRIARARRALERDDDHTKPADATVRHGRGGDDDAPNGSTAGPSAEATERHHRRLAEIAADGDDGGER